jgi:hypothetical protein
MWRLGVGGGFVATDRRAVAGYPSPTTNGSIVKQLERDKNKTEASPPFAETSRKAHVGSIVRSDPGFFLRAREMRGE